MTVNTVRPARLDVAELRDWLGEQDAPRILDVRSAAEFGTAHIPGSYNVPLDLLREHREELHHHLEDAVVLVCRSGARAGQAETLLAGAGLPNLHVLDGGVLAWEKAGAPLLRGTERWALERQVRLAAGGLVLTGILISTVFPRAKWLAGAVGGGLVGAAVTDSCVMGQLLSKLPYNQDAGCDLQSVLRELSNE